jgi:DNA repair proteins
MSPKESAGQGVEYERSDLPEERDVREKLLVKGAAGLSDEELLCILLQNSGREPNAFVRARSLLGAFDGSLARMAAAGMQRLRVTQGTGMKKAALLACAFELGRRAYASEAVSAVTTINSPEDVRNLWATTSTGCSTRSSGRYTSAEQTRLSTRLR